MASANVSLQGKLGLKQISGSKSAISGGKNTAGKASFGTAAKGKSVAFPSSAIATTQAGLGDVAVENKAPKTWKQILSNTVGQPKCTLAFKPLADATYLNNDVIITPPLAFLNESRSKWNSSVVGYFLGSNLAFSFVREQAFSNWGALGLVKVFFDSKGFYTLKFKSEIEKEKFLAAGPYHIGHKAFYVKPWIEGTFFTKEAVTTVPLWLKFHNVPTSYWSEDGLSFIASSVGKPVAWDNATALLEPMKFARICVEISVASLLPNNVIVPVLSDVDLSIVRVPVLIEYAALPASCTTCKVFGHSSAKCPHPKWQPTGETSGLKADGNEGVLPTCDTTENAVDVSKAAATSIVAEPVIAATTHDSASQNETVVATNDESDGGIENDSANATRADDKSVFIVDAKTDAAGPASVPTQDDDSSTDASEGSSCDSDEDDYDSDLEPFAVQIDAAIADLRDQKIAKGGDPQVYSVDVFTYFDSKGNWNEGLKEALRLRVKPAAPKLPTDMPASNVKSSTKTAKTEPSTHSAVIKDPDDVSVRSESSQPPVLSKRQRQRLRQRGFTPPLK